jgi:MFS family permease
MSDAPAAGINGPDIVKASWLPLVIVMLCQIQLSFNAWNVSITGITEDLGIAPTEVGTALTTGTFAMASFVLLGAKLGARIGVRLAFQIGVGVPAFAAMLIASAQNGTTLLVAQFLSGMAIALAAPALTVIIASNYHGKQQGQAIGFLAAAIPLAQVVSILIAGVFATTIGWRWSFVTVALIGVVNFLLSWKLQPIPAQKDLVIDGRGAALVSVAVLSLSLGFTTLNSWGLLEATEAAPFDVVGLSPVPLILIFGVVVFQGFFRWTRVRMDDGKAPLFSLDVLKSNKERAVTYCMAIMLFVGTAASFLLPLYMQTVQGYSGIKTSLSIIPYTLSIVIANSFVSRLYDRYSPGQIARVGFVVVAASMALLAFTIRNDWDQLIIVLGLITLGLAQGCIVALVFNTLLTAAPKHLAGDVGAWRGLTHNLSGSAGIAVATALAVGFLGFGIARDAQASPAITPQLAAQVNLDNVNFLTNEQLEAVLDRTSATQEQKDAAIAIFENNRLGALKATMLILALLALLAIVPAGRMPDFREGDLPVGYPEPEPDDVDANV